MDSILLALEKHGFCHEMFWRNHCFREAIFRARCRWFCEGCCFLRGCFTRKVANFVISRKNLCWFWRVTLLVFPDFFMKSSCSSFLISQNFFWFRETRGILRKILSRNPLLLCKASLFICEICYDSWSFFCDLFAYFCDIVLFPCGDWK